MVYSKYTVLALLLGSLICFGLLIVLAVVPGSATIHTRVGEAEIDAQASRRWVLQSGDCVQVSWNMQNIQSVYVNGEGRIGEDRHEFCIDDEPRTFKFEVHFNDNTVRTYNLTVGFMGYQPEIWLLSALGMMFLVAAVYLRVSLPVKKHYPCTARRIGHAVRFVELLAISLVTVALMVEAGLRYYFDRYGTEDDRIKYIYDDEQIRRDSAFEPLPFVEQVLSRGAGNSLGYRGDEITIPKPAGVYRIVVVGDSTVFGLATPTNLTLPAQLQAVLRDTYGYSNVEVINAGVSGYNTWNSVVNLEFRVLELEPDLILVYHTITDIGQRQVDPACYRGINPHRGLPPISNMLQIRRQVPTSSVLLRFMGINLDLFDTPDPDNNVVPAIACAAVPAPPMEEALDENPPVYFERNLRIMVAVAREFDIEIMLSTWAYDSVTLPRPDWWNGAFEHNDVIREVAHDEQTLFFDLESSTMSTTPEDWGADRVHPHPQGYRHQAELYAAYLDEQGIIPRPD